MEPYEIIMSPADVYIALEGETFPAIDAVPGGNWVLLGKAGKRNQASGGVKVAFKSAIKKHTTTGALGWVKAFRSAAEITCECTIEDLTLETFAKNLNLAGIREVAAASGVAGYKSMGLSQGFDVQTWGILVRIPASPYGDGMSSQFEFPKGIQEGNATLALDSEGSAAGLQFLYGMLEDPNASSEYERLGRFVAQTALALP